MPSQPLDYSAISKSKNLPPPPGFSPSTSTSKASAKAVTTASSSYNALRERRAWDLATSPVKSLPMQVLMLYMSGGGVQIFSMGIVFVLLTTPFKNIASMNTAFAPFSPPKENPNSLLTLPLQKLAYLVCNLLTLAVGLWKCSSMGLLPMGTGDWVEFETRGSPPELSLF